MKLTDLAPLDRWIELEKDIHHDGYQRRKGGEIGRRH